MEQPHRTAYGSTDEMLAAHSKDFDAGWSGRGDPRHLTIEFGVTVGKQFIALTLVLVQVFHSRNLLMSCDTRKPEVTFTIGVLCEYSKAYVRCFPLLAVVVSLIVASRMMLLQRMYYKMLKKYAILDFRPVYPGKDLLFLVLCWSAFNAFTHFILELSVNHPLDNEMLRKLRLPEATLLAEIHEMASLYVLPSLVFLGFLWQAYDVETRLLPLSKYFDQDPDQARRILAGIHFLDESVAARVVKQHLHSMYSEGHFLTSDEVFSKFVKRCTFEAKVKSTRSPAEDKTPASDDSPGSVLMQGLQEDVLEQFSHVHLISEMWPGRLLLDHRLSDEGSANFRKYWFGCCTLGIGAMVLMLVLLIEQLVGDIKDVLEGQYEDISGVIIVLVHTLFILYLAPAFLKNAIVPYLKAFKEDSV